MPVYRAAFPMIFAVWFLQISGGILGLITPLGLKDMGVGLSGIGVVASLSAVGFMIGALSAPKLISRIGNIRCFSFAAALCCISCLCMDVWQSAYTWGLLRLGLGAGFALMFTSLESWLGAAILPEQRGSVTSVYHLISKAAVMTGPLLIFQYAPLESVNFTLAGIFLATALIPICLTKQVEPPRATLQTKSLSAMAKLAPSAVIGAFIAGFVNSGVTALLPVFMRSFSTAEQITFFAALALVFLNIGGLIFQWPMGWLSDRMDRRLVIGICAMISAIAGVIIILFFAKISSAVLLSLLCLWGMGALVFYGISVAHGVDRAEESQITQMMSLLIFVWAVGSVIGPIVIGFTMNSGLGNRALFIVPVMLHILLAFYMIVRKNSRTAPPEEAREDWSPAMASSVAIMDLDPRNPDSL